MTRDYRPLPEDRRLAFRSMVEYAFRPTEGRGDPDEDDLEAPRNQFGERRGLFVGDDLRAICKHYFFTAGVRGESQDVAGLGAVATPPEHRRQGLVRDLLAESLAEYRDRDVPLSTLWPFERPFYARFGWATANTYRETRFPPDAVADAAPDDGGAFHPVDPDDGDALAAMNAVYEADAAGFGLAIERSPDWWRHRVLTGWETDPFAYRYERDGETRGYLVYDVTEEDDDRVLRVWDHAGRTPGDFRHLLGFLANHDSQVDTVVLREYGGSDLLDLVLDPGPVEATVKTGPMVRIVDVEAALARVAPATTDLDGVVLAVTDPLADWNDDRFRLTVGDRARVERTDADPDVSLSVGPLSQLVAGTRSLSALTRTGDATVHDEAAGARLAAAYPTVPTSLRDFF